MERQRYNNQNIVLHSKCVRFPCRVLDGSESRMIRKAEGRRIDDLALLCWGRWMYRPTP